MNPYRDVASNRLFSKLNRVKHVLPAMIAAFAFSVKRNRGTEFTAGSFTMSLLLGLITVRAPDAEVRSEIHISSL